MADQNIQIGVSVDLGNAPQTVGDLKKEFRETLNAIDQAKKGTDEYFQQLAKAAELKGQITELRREIKLLDPREQFGAVAGSVKGLAGGLEAAAGAAAIFGSKNKELEETLKQVQGAILLFEGFQHFVTGLRRMNDLWGVFKIRLQQSAIAARAAAASNAAVAVSLDGEAESAVVAETATKGFNTALAAGAIGAILLLIPLLAMGMKSVGEETEKAGEITKATNEVNEKAADNINEEYSKVTVLVATIKDETTSKKEKKEAVDKLIAQHPNYFNNLSDEHDLVKKLGEDYHKFALAIIEEAKAKAAEGLVQEKGKELLKAQVSEEEQLANAQHLFSIGAIKDLKIYEAQIRATSDAAIAKINEQINTYAKLAVSAKENLTNLGGDIDQDNTKNKKDKDAAAKKEALKSLQDYIMESQKINENAEERELTEEDKKYADLKEKLISAGVSTVKLTEEYEKNVLAIKVKYAKEQADQLSKIFKEQTAKDKEEQNKGLADLEKGLESYIKKSENIDESARQKEINEENDKYKKLINEAMLYGGNIEAIEIQHQTNLATIKKKFDDQDATEVQKSIKTNLTQEIAANNAELRLHNLNYNQKKALLDKEVKDAQTALQAKALTQDEYTRVIDENAKAQKAIKKQQQQDELQFANATAGLLDTLASAAGAHTQTGKDLAIAGATIKAFSTIANIIEGFSELGPFGVAAGIAVAAATAVNLFENIKKIEAVKVPKGGSSSSSGLSASGGGLSAPAPQIPVQAQTTNISQSSINRINQGQQQNSKVFVTERDISSTQQTVGGYQRASVIGGRR